MKPLLENESLPYSQEELHHVLSTIDHISNVDFSTEALLSNITMINRTESHYICRF